MLQSTRQSCQLQRLILARTGGEVAACVADVDALEELLTPQLLRQHRADIQSAPIVLLDGNLSPEAILVR